MNKRRKNWYTCQHSLPYPISRAAVVASADESMAVITGSCKDGNASDKVMIFSEDKGFTIFEPFSLQTARWNHVSIKLQ